MVLPIVTGRVVDFTGRKLVVGDDPFNRQIINLSGVITMDANESGSTSGFEVIYRQGGTASSNPGYFVGEPNGLGDKTLAWLQKPWVDVTAVTRDPVNAQGLQASQSVALFGSGGAATAAAIFNRRGIVWSRLAPGGDALLKASVNFNWKREYYGLFEAAPDGQVYFIRGPHSDFSAGDHKPSPTPGRFQLCAVYMYNDIPSLIDLTDWKDDKPTNPHSASVLDALIAYNQTTLAPFFAKCATGGTVRVASYTDSTGIAPPAATPFETSPLVTGPNGPGRDEPSFWNYATKLTEFASVPVLHSFDGRQIVKRTPAWWIVEALKLKYPQTTFVYDNWGIGGSSLSDLDYAEGGNPSEKTSPGARWPTRLNTMLASAPDLILNSFGMNTFPFATNNVASMLTDLIEKQRAALPNVAIINIDCNPINADNTNPLANRSRYNRNNRQVSRRLGCGIINLDLPAYDRRGWYGLDNNSYAAQNNWNHFQDYEGKQTGRISAIQMGLPVPAGI